MNRKIIGILGLVGLVLTGCAAPEVETEQTMMGSYSSDEIMQDNVKNGIFPCWKICCVQGQI